MIINKRRLSVPTAAVFFRQVAAMVAAGVPIKEAFTSAAQDKPDVFGLAQSYLGDGVPEKGKIDFFKRVFDYLDKNNGPNKNIAASLYSVADEIDKYRDFKVAMGQLLFVPIMTLMIAGVVLAVLFVFVIPVWQDFFANMPGSLPTATQLLVHINDFVWEYGYIFVMVIILIVGLLIVKWKSLITVLSVFPMARRLFVCQSMVRFTRYLSVLLHIEMPLKEAAVLAAEEVRHRSHANALKQAVQNMTGSDQLNVSLQKLGFITSVVGRILDTGEKSGTLAETLNSVSVLYEKEADIALSKTVYWSDIIVKFVVGAIVGLTVISMYLPIFRMANTIG